MKSPIQIVFFILLAIAISSALWQHAHLPERVAAHFDAHGNPNGWLERNTHTGLQIATLLFMTALFQGLGALNRRLPKEYINIPRRDYWLAPERAAATHQFIADMVLQLGCSVLVFFIALFYFVYRANLLTSPILNLQAWWIVGALLTFSLVVVISMITRFARIPKS